MTNTTDMTFPRLDSLARRNRVSRFKDLILTASILVGISAGAVVTVSKLSTVV